MKNKSYMLAVILSLTLLAGCGKRNIVNENRTDSDSETKEIAVFLDGNSAECDSDAVSCDGSVVTISEEGTYLLSGALDNGMVIVNAEKNDKIELVLNGVTINSDTSAAVYVAQAEEVVLTLAPDSVNILSNGGEFKAIDDNKIDAAVFSKDDLTMSGEGTLNIDSPAGHGIVSKDGLSIEGGKYTITSGKKGIHANDTAEVADGEITITKSKEGIEGKDIVISGGTINLTADDDGINASDGSISISGGRVCVNASGDGVDANGSVIVSGGETYISGPTDDENAPLDYDEEAIISGGIFVAAGSSGEAQNFSISSTQGAMLVYVSGTENDVLTLTDSSGKELLNWTAEKVFECVVISCPEMKKGETYTVTCAGNIQEVTI